jgi:LPXTG-site transpeptidase (sortase) family protein
MTESSGRRRRRRRASGASGTSSWASRGRRSLVALALISVIVLVAVGLSIALGGGGAGPNGSPSQAAVASGLPLVSSAPSIDASFPPVATDSPTPSPTPNLGIRATRLQIDRLGIDLKIVEGDGIDAPIGKAAHYPGTGWPGSGTNIYIYAHARTGMFLSLWDVKLGDQVVVTLVDGTERTYVVGKVIPKVPWDAVTYLGATPTEQLTLQTSTSYYATAPRFIAIAYPTP